MRSLWLLLTLTTLTLAAEIEEENGVLVLTKATFDQALEEHEHLLVEFYAPWCGHCKALAPEYDKAAEQLKSSGSKIRLAKVDATIEKDLGSQFQVQGFPTLKFFKKGSPKEYNGPRKADGIVSWLEKKTGPPAKDVSSVDDAKKLIEDKEVVIIGFFKDKDSDQAKEFIKAADDNDEQTYGITSDSGVFKEYEVKKDSAIILFKKFDEGKNVFDGDFKAKDINAFVSANSIPLINDFSQETAPKIFGSDVKVHFLLLAKKDADDFDKWVEALKPAAKEAKGKMIFVTVDAAKKDNAQVLEFFGVKEDQTPQYLIFEMEKSAKYFGKKDSLDKDSVGAFVKDFFKGKLERTLKSEDVPEDWDKTPVKVLVSKNFKEVALDKSKDVFVEFYAPWCGHCKALAPKWDELGEMFKDHESIVIAKMDSTANEVEEVQVQGFPTLKLFKKDTNEIVDYNGKREVADMAKFLETGKQDGGMPSEEEEDEDYDDEGEDEHDEL